MRFELVARLVFEVPNEVVAASAQTTPQSRAEMEEDAFRASYQAFYDDGSGTSIIEEEVVCIPLPSDELHHNPNPVELHAPPEHVPAWEGEGEVWSHAATPSF